MDLNTIVEGVLQGRKEDFRLIIQCCNQALYRTALVILKNEADAEDAMQSAYLKAYTHLSSFRKESAFQTWLTRILINECKMMLRSRRATVDLDAEEITETPSENENAMEELNKSQLNQLLEQAVMRLPEKYRLVYVVREVNEMTTERTANILGLSEENVKVRLHRAKALIRENLLQSVTPNDLFSFGSTRCASLADRVMLAIDQLPAKQAVQNV